MAVREERELRQKRQGLGDAVLRRDCRMQWWLERCQSEGDYRCEQGSLADWFLKKKKQLKRFCPGQLCDWRRWWLEGTEGSGERESLSPGCRLSS